MSEIKQGAFIAPKLGARKGLLNKLKEFDYTIEEDSDFTALRVDFDSNSKRKTFIDRFKKYLSKEDIEAIYKSNYILI